MKGSERASEGERERERGRERGREKEREGERARGEGESMCGLMPLLVLCPSVTFTLSRAQAGRKKLIMFVVCLCVHSESVSVFTSFASVFAVSPTGLGALCSADSPSG